MERINFSAMVTTATNKYIDLVHGMYETKASDNKELFERNISLINSIYKDEMDLLSQLCVVEALQEVKKPKKKELKIPSFMAR